MKRKLANEELGRKSADEFRSSSKTPVLVILDNIRSHHNVGSVFRTADAFALEGVWLCGYTPVPPHREIHKTALGATDTMEWKHFQATSDAIREARQAGYKLIAVEQTEGSILLQDITKQFPGRVALVFGNEVGGVDQGVIDACDAVLEVPQEGTKHSINISVCAGVVLWEFFRFHLYSD
jgi:23S rRNA (guanosine2251-2'-O)-methyltransferase